MREDLKRGKRNDDYKTLKERAELLEKKVDLLARGINEKNQVIIDISSKLNELIKQFINPQNQFNMYNNATLIGNVGKDPEVKTLGTGTKLAKFSLATNKTYKRAGEKVQETTWHAVTAFGKLAELVENYVNKGDSLLIVGAINNGDYEKTDGSKAYYSEIVADVIRFNGKGAESTKSANKAPAPSNQVSPTNEQEDDDLPF